MSRSPSAVAPSRGASGMKPTRGNGSTSTASLEPQRCVKCQAVLEVAVCWTGEHSGDDEVVCPNGCEDCV